MNVILIAEDSPTNLKLMRILLGKMGLPADGVLNGEQAVSAARKNRYALIFMDVMMPGMDGLTAARAIRQAEMSRQHRAAIIAVTASSFTRQDCLRAGMDDYIQKPINPEILRNRVEYWVKQQIKSFEALPRVP